MQRCCGAREQEQAGRDWQLLGVMESSSAGGSSGFLVGLSRCSGL